MGSARAGDGCLARPVGVAGLDGDRRTWELLWRALLASDEFNCCGCFGTAAEGIECVPKLPVGILLVGFALPDGCGIRCIRELRARQPGLRFILTSNAPLDSLGIRGLVVAGADSCLVKPFTPAQCLVMLRLSAARCQPAHSRLALSEREERLLACLAEGLTYKETADRLGVSISMVKKLVQRIFHRLRAHSRVIAVNQWRQIQ